MKLLNTRWGGLIARCPNCYALLGYQPEDVTATQQVSCIQCHMTLWVPLNPNYDGVIKESEEKK